MSEIKRYLKQQKEIIIYYQSLTNGAEVDTPAGDRWKFNDLDPLKFFENTGQTSLNDLHYLAD